MKKSDYPDIESIRAEVAEKQAAGISVSEMREAFLGKNGSVKVLLQALGQEQPELRAARAAAIQELRTELEQLLSQPAAPTAAVSGSADITLPSLHKLYGSIHPITAMAEEMVGIFRDLSFEVAEGPEIVQDKENFEQLNLGPEHPARDGHDSFYLTENLLLRTHTTAVQVLEMNKRMKQGKLPMRIVVPGKTYRRESDQTHSAMFHQLDAVVVDTQTTFADLRGTLDYFAKRLFGDQVETRFRPHHFPFTEPSAELDIRWKGESSLQGKHAQWLEMGGCGMIHPEVLKRAGINPKIYQGWAFGMSIERPIMVRHHIPDLRLLYANAVPTLEQFSYHS